ncbi:MAG: AsmA family protein [Hyphomicrobiales bacterium]|nr:AsmA family protein [Hyphomicrobiales bacterium]
MRDFFVIVGSLLIAVLLAAFAVPRFIDWAPYKRDIEKRIRAETGLELTLAGPLRIEILPKLALNAQDVIIDGKEAKVSAARMRGEVSVGSLFSKTPRLVSIELDGGVVKVPEGAATDPATALIDAMSRPNALQVDTLTLNTIAVTRADDDTPIATIEHGEASFPVRAGPLRLSAEGVLGNVSGRGRFAIGPPEPGLVRHVSLAFDADGTNEGKGWRLTYEGQATASSASPVSFEGAVTLAQNEGAGLRAASGAGSEAPAWRAQAKAHGELRALRLDEIEITRGESTPLRLTGQGSLDLTGDPKIALDLATRRLALDAIVAANLPDAKASDAGGGAPLAGSLDTLGRLVVAAVPPPLSVDFNLRADNADLADESFGNLVLKGRVTANDLSIFSLNANWLGRGDIAFSGNAEGGSKALARGHIDVKAPDAATLLQGLGLSGEGANSRIPLALSGELTLDRRGARIDGLELTLAGSRITGRLSSQAAASGRPAHVEAELSSRDLDLESWPLGAVTQVLPASLAGRAQIHVERLRAGKGAGDVGRLDMSISRNDGETTIDKLELQGFEGLSISGAGAIGGAGSSFQARIAAPKAAPLAALSRLVLPQAAVDLVNARRASLEPFALTFSARRVASSQLIDVALSGTAAASHLDAKASLDADLAPRSAEIDLTAPEASVLLGQLGITAGPGDPLGRGEVKMTAKPAEPGTLAVTANLSAGTARLSGDGTLRIGQGAPEGHGGFNISAPDLATAQRLMGFPQHFDGDPRFDIAGGWTLSADALALERLNIRLLGLHLDGELSFGLGSDARLTGTVEAPTLSVPALAAMALGPTRAQPGQSPWASARFPSYQAPKLAVSLRLASPFIDLGGGLTAHDAKLNLELDERGVTLASGTSELANGKLAGDWRIERDGGLARSALRLSAENLDLKSLVQGGGIAGQVSGRIELAGAGETFSQIVASSGGSGSVRVSDGWLEQAGIGGLRRGFTRAVADDNLMDKSRLANVLAAETARGALTGVSFEAPLVATNGILRTTIPRLSLAENDGAAEATAALDLKTLSLDARLGLSTVSTDRPENSVPLAAALTWKGPLFALKREADASALLQAVSVERLRIELERIELLEYDQREQATFNRRLKAGRQKAMPLPVVPEIAAAPSSPVPEAPTPAAPGAPAAANGSEGETAARETPSVPAAPAPVAGEPPAPPPLVRAPQPPSRPPQATPSDPSGRTSLSKPDAVPLSPLDALTAPTLQLAPLPPEITVPPAPGVAGAPTARPTFRRPPATNAPLILHSPD